MHRQYNAWHLPVDRRRGSTLIIVVALLGLLSILGFTFYTFARQERSAAEYFAANAKQQTELPDNPFQHGDSMVLVGSADSDSEYSILASQSNRHGIVQSLLGQDLTPHNGHGEDVIYDPVSRIPQGSSGTLGSVNYLLNFVDSLAAWGDTNGDGIANFSPQDFYINRSADAVPAPDVDYTAPDINNLFLAHKAFTVRKNASGIYEQVPVIIPSYFRPQYLKSSQTNGPSANNVPTDFNWYPPAYVGPTAYNDPYQSRSFRPSPNHIGGYDRAGNPVFAYIDATRDPAGIWPESGAFPFRPNENGNSANFGHLGVWTGHAPTDFELDSDNDGDGIKEGIWMNLGYPIQETSDGRFYATLFSYTIYDLDGLLNLNAVGNVSNLPRDTTIPALVASPGLGAGNLSVSNMGLGPNEINPLYALRPDSATADTDQRFVDWYQAQPSNTIAQANMEWMWLLTGRMDNDGGTWTNRHAGRWGDEDAMYDHMEVFGQTAHTLPRPGSMGATYNTPVSGGWHFGGYDGDDDNLDAAEGLGGNGTGVLRGFVQPLDYAGAGSNSNSGDFRLPDLFQTTITNSAAWMRYTGYSAISDAVAILNDSQYMPGPDGIFGTADDLSVSQFLNALFEDPLETIIDEDLKSDSDDIFSVQDLLIAHLSVSDAQTAQGIVSERLRHLAPKTFAESSYRAERFTTLSHSLRRVPLAQQLGADGIFGTADDGARAWEWNADAEGDKEDTNNNGILDPGEDVDGNGIHGGYEFPPKFGVAEYSDTDPFRPELRTLLRTEVGTIDIEAGQLPLSLNHVLDVNDRDQLSSVATAAQVFMHIQNYGMQFRSLVEHPAAAGTVTALPILEPAWPPASPADLEYWARRDRQKLARDIYVLLYTLGGAQVSGASVIDYTADNSTRTLYTNQRLRQMAQFAVNMVDAMDTDNVITRFEYDKNLGDGWGLDDNPDTQDEIPSTTPTDTGTGLYPEDSATNRGVVYGVEAQQLAFSEVLGIRSAYIPEGDHAATPYDDDDVGFPDGRDFLFVELQNMLPQKLDLASTNSTTDAKAVWRVSRFDRTASDAVVNDPSNTNPAIAILEDLENVIDGGGRFSISVASDPGLATSSFFVDLGTDATAPSSNAPGNGIAFDATFDGTYELIAPDAPAGSIELPDTTNVAGSTSPGYTEPLCDIDVLHVKHASRFAEVNGNFLDTMVTYAGNDTFNIPPSSQIGFDLVLQRRLNPNLLALDEDENPWIEVDRFAVSFTNFDIVNGDTPTDLWNAIQLAGSRGKVEEIRATERDREPLNAAVTGMLSVSDSKTPVTPSLVNPDTLYRYHTLKGSEVPTNKPDSLGINATNLTDTTKHVDAGSNPALHFQLWQAHFDREYASPGELFNLPIVGPNLITRSLDRMRYPGWQQAHDDPTTTVGTPDSDLIAGAAGMFLQPRLLGAVSTAKNNAWHRLLSFVEVPSRVNRAVGNYLDLQRLPGKLNLNTIRHREVYAGLLDNPNIVSNTLPVLTDSGADGFVDGPFLISTQEDGNSLTTGPYRDRWMEFVAQRDGSFDLDGVSTIWLPGLPNSRPFRSAAHVFHEDTNGNGILDPSEDINANGILDPGEDANNNGIMDPGEDKNGNGILDDGLDQTIFRQSDADTGTSSSNRHWLEAGTQAFHDNPDSITGGGTANMVHRHQFLSKIMNNTTTVSNCFVMFKTAAYFEAVFDSGVYRIGGRMGLDTDGDGIPTNDIGWEMRGVTVIDRSGALAAWDPITGSFDKDKLIKANLNLKSDGN